MTEEEKINGENNYSEEDQRGNCCSQTEVLTPAAFKSDTVGVVNKQVGITGWRGRAKTIRAAVG